MNEDIFRLAGLRCQMMVWTGCLLIAIALPSPSHAQDALYQQGLSAYQTGDYLNAVKFLFAYKQLSAGNLTPAFADQIDRAVSFSEQRVRAILSSSAPTVESGGKFDKPDGGGKTVGPPGGSRDKKPVLPASPTSVSAARPSSVVVAPLATGTKEIPKGAMSAGVAAPKSLEEQLADLQNRNAELERQLALCREMANRSKKKLPD